MIIANIISERDPSDIVSCDVSTQVAKVIGVLAGKRIGALPIMRDGQIAGIVSERDVIYKLADIGNECLDLPVEAIMTSPSKMARPDSFPVRLL